MQRVYLLSALILSAFCLVSCNPDSRLNGVWEGSQWQDGKEVDDTQVTFEFNNGSLKISQNAGSISLNLQGSYVTDVQKFPNQILFTVNISSDIAYVRKGIYRFNLPLFGKTLYLSVTQSDEGDYPAKEKLNPDVGPVYILKKK